MLSLPIVAENPRAEREAPAGAAAYSDTAGYWHHVTDMLALVEGQHKPTMSARTNQRYRGDKRYRSDGFTAMGRGFGSPVGFFSAR